MTDSPAQPPEQSTATASEPHVFVHRWPWRTEEFVSMGVAFALVLGVGWLGYVAGISRLPQAVVIGWLTLTILGSLGSIFALYRVKTSRVTTSQITVTVTGSQVRVESNGAVGTSHGDVTRTTSIGYRQYGSDETFMFSDGDRSLRLPLRAAADPLVREAVETAFATAKTISEDARDLYEDL